MIDLETLSLKPNAMILSIGAVMFDAEIGNIGAQLHIGCVMYGQGRDLDRDVVKWWAEPKQKAAYDEIMMFVQQKPYRLDLALAALSRFIVKHNPKQIWGNSPSFDLSILANAYQQHDMTMPWPFWNERDTRTIVNVCRQLTGVDPKKQIEFDGTAHSALADAIYQARYVIAAYQLLASRSAV
ncbi:3'-5' exonuclease [Methylomonas sp. MS20]